MKLPSWVWLVQLINQFKQNGTAKTQGYMNKKHVVKRSSHKNTSILLSAAHDVQLTGSSKDLSLVTVKHANWISSPAVTRIYIDWLTAAWKAPSLFGYLMAQSYWVQTFLHKSDIFRSSFSSSKFKLINAHTSIKVLHFGLSTLLNGNSYFSTLNRDAMSDTQV